MAGAERRVNNYFEKQGKSDPYKEFYEGQQIAFTLKTIYPNGRMDCSQKDITIDRIAGGGFFGKVLISDNQPFIIKTAQPDPWHHFWRTINWDMKPFPAQHDELAAQLEHISGRLIHKALPVITDGKFYAPQSLGYTQLKTGFSQVVEKVHGRPPRFDTQENEYEKFKQAQEELTQIALDLGLEQAGQIYRKGKDVNPFGMANFWYDDTNQSWVWFDTIPAIPHRGFVYPAFRFPFHRKLREEFSENQRTFNTIHTSRFRVMVYLNRHKFPPRVLEEIFADLNLYDKIHARYSSQKQSQKDTQAILDALAGIDRNLEDTMKKILSTQTIKNIARLITDRNYANKHIFFRGTDHAKRHGLISEEEWQNAWKAIDETKLTSQEKGAIYGGIVATFATISIASKVLKLAGVFNIASAQKGFIESVALGASVYFAIKGSEVAVRYVATCVTEMVTNTDLSAAKRLSLIPDADISLLLSSTAEGARRSGTESNRIWHDTIRYVIAKLSEIFPHGGPGSELEATMWKLFGKRLEELGYARDERTFFKLLQEKIDTGTLIPYAEDFEHLTKTEK